MRIWDNICTYIQPTLFNLLRYRCFNIYPMQFAKASIMKWDYMSFFARVMISKPNKNWVLSFKASSELSFGCECLHGFCQMFQWWTKDSTHYFNIRDIVTKMALLCLIEEVASYKLHFSLLVPVLTMFAYLNEFNYSQLPVVFATSRISDKIK